MCLSVSKCVCVCLCVPFLILILTQFLRELWPRVTWCEVSLVVLISVHVKPAKILLFRSSRSALWRREDSVSCAGSDVTQIQA